MNFRNLDSSDARAGLSGGSDIDASVWARFFDAGAGTVRADVLDAEFRRLWGSAGAEPPDAMAARSEAVEREASRLALKPLADLMERHRAAGRSPKPKMAAAPSQRFERDPLVVAIVKVRPGFRCEVQGCTHSTFLDCDARPYYEVHHIDPLGAGGDDTPENVACVCPTHHREAHHGAEAEKIRRALLDIRRSAGAKTQPAATSGPAPFDRAAGTYP